MTEATETAVADEVLSELLRRADEEIETFVIGGDDDFPVINRAGLLGGLRDILDEARAEARELLSGKRAVIPQTREHAEALYAVALGCLKSYGVDPNRRTDTAVVGENAKARVLARYRETHGDDYAVLGSDTGTEAHAVLNKNPEERKRAYAEVGAVLASPPPPQPGVRVTVKPLEWRDSEAETPFGTTYMIHDTTAFLGDASYDLWMRGAVEDDEGFFVSGGFATWNEATDAAQADHESRIRSALTASIPDSGERWQDIATAPRDGTNVLLYTENVREYASQVVGHWGRSFFGEKWFDYSGMKPLLLAPTYWRPLPAPPSP